MAVSALHAAASGMRAQDQKLNVLANNLANINTVGFKRSRANFEDLLYQQKREPGVPNADDEMIPHGIQVGMGVRLSGTQLNFEPGPLEVTDKPLDWAVLGDGFFQVRTTEGGNEVIAYTRAGNFVRNAQGLLVLANTIGSILEPPITIPEEAPTRSVEVSPDGRVFVTLPGQIYREQVGQIELARFVNAEGLRQKGENLFTATDASGEPISGTPTEDALGEIADRTLELSNVDPVRELVDLIFAQRAFELNSQSLQSADETLQIVGNLRRY